MEQHTAGKSIMVQGTSSHVGKSLIAAALCRVFAGAGARVAPFKAQNMALNSFALASGGEIGRAQAFQAECAGVVPTARMNPVLLKPTGESSSQVVVLGKARSVMSAREYHREKPGLMRVVLESFDALTSEYDIVVAEGAGSPVEVNLRSADIVNMGLALETRSPVVLVGDIDRGGVFASIVGTLELMSSEERELVKGFIINKFRGDSALLTPGLEFLEQRTGKPVLGVVPYIDISMLPGEDSVSLEGGAGFGSGPLKIKVIKLPRISNFTDFDAFRCEADVGVDFVSTPSGLNGAHMVVVPGSKNSTEDLKWIKSRGLDKAITEYAATGGTVAGICGGMQMLGTVIRDPYGVETSEADSKGLGLLELETTFAREKNTFQAEAVCALPTLCRDIPVTGYEIHMGESRSSGPAFSNITARSGASVSEADGAVSSDGRVWGTYLHGIFDNDLFRTELLNGLRAGAGLPTSEQTGYQAKRRAAIDELARVVSGSVDIKRLAEAAGLTGLLKGV